MTKIKVSNGMAGVGDRVMYKADYGEYECVVMSITHDYDANYPVYCKGIATDQDCYCSYGYAEKNLVLLNTFSEEGIKELFDILLSD